jgi:hypothetical protein
MFFWDFAGEPEKPPIHPLYAEHGSHRDQPRSENPSP